MSSSNDNCIFCRIANKSENTEILLENEKYVIICDIRPAASHHYLVITKNHIRNGKSLTRNDIDMVNEMKEFGLEFLKTKDASLVQDCRLGFHWPPFNSIAHLHLHLIAPASQLSFISNIIFKPGSWWFVTVDDLIKWLSSR